MGSSYGNISSIKKIMNANNVTQLRTDANTASSKSLNETRTNYVVSHVLGVGLCNCLECEM